MRVLGRIPRARRGLVARWLVAAGVAAVWSTSAVASAETLSADEALKRAAAKNPTLRVALLDAQAAQQAALAEKKAREPVLAASAQGSHTEAISTGGGNASRIENNQAATNVAVRYTTDVGTALEVGTQVDMTIRGAGGVGTSGAGGTLAQVAPGPSYSAQAYVSARQPLLRGAGTDSVLAPQVQAQASATAAQKQSELTASQTALDVMNAYWELWYAEQAAKVQEKALALAERQLADAKARLALGTASQADVLQFSSQVASITEALTNARATQSTRAIELGRTLSIDASLAGDLHADGELPSLGAVPAASVLTARAQEESQDLEAARAELAAARSRAAAADDADQPRLDVFARVTAGGTWADDNLPGLALPGTRPAISVVGGLELEMPFAGGRAAADNARARTQLQAAEARYQARLDAVKANVSSQRVTAETAGTQVSLASETAKIAGELAQAERQRLALGTTTASEVVRAEQTAREAELRKLRAQVSQVTSRLQLDHTTGALLDRYATTFSKVTP